MPTMAFVHNLFGTVKFYKACRSAGVKPLIGVDVWMEPLALDGGADKNPSRLLLLVQNKQGYLNLCEMLARAWTRNAQRTQDNRRNARPIIVLVDEIDAAKGACQGQHQDGAA